MESLKNKVIGLGMKYPYRDLMLKLIYVFPKYSIKINLSQIIFKDQKMLRMKTTAATTRAGGGVPSSCSTLKSSYTNERCF